MLSSEGISFLQLLKLLTFLHETEMQFRMFVNCGKIFEQKFKVGLRALQMIRVYLWSMDQ